MQQQHSKRWHRRRMTSILLSLMMFFSYAGALPAVALNSVQPQIWDASQKTPQTALAAYLDKGLSVAGAQRLLAAGEHAEGSLLVKVAQPNALQNIKLQTGEIKGGSQLFTVPQSVGETGAWLKLEVDAQGRPANLMAELSQQKGVLAVEPDYVLRLPETAVLEAAAGQGGGQTAEAAAPADLNQYYLNGYGIPEGWDWLQQRGLTPGQGVKVAVVDSGVDYTHPDLQNQILRHPDGSIWGESFAQGEPDVMDYNGHGTHVAGIIAAGKNDFGVTGVSYGAKIMPVRVSDREGTALNSAVLEGLKYAIVQGADVINLSLGGVDSSQAEQEMLDLAASLGIIVVAAAGNDGAPNGPVGDLEVDRPIMNAAYYSVVGVMAESKQTFGDSDRLAYFSNWDSNPGDAVEYNLMAPGQDIYSTYLRGGYRNLSGTSMSSPLVAGMAANLAGYVKAKGLDGLTDYTTEAKYNYLFSQITGASPYAQGVTHAENKAPLQYREANQLAMLTGKPQPSLALLESDGLVIKELSEDLRLTFFNQHGSTKNTTITATSQVPGVVVNDGKPLTGANLNLQNAGKLQVALPIQAAEGIASGTVIPIDIQVTYGNAKDGADKTVYTLQETVEVTYYHASVLSQEELNTKKELDASQMWIIDSALQLPVGQTLTVTPGAELLFMRSGSLDVAGRLEVRGNLSQPVQVYAWGNYAAITEVGQGVVNIDYLIIRQPLLVASQVKHTDVWGSMANLNGYAIVADDIAYCTFNDTVLNLFADSLTNSQLSNVLGEFQVQRVENNVLIPLTLADEAGEMLLPKFIGASYALDLEQLRPLRQENGQVQIALPADCSLDQQGKPDAKLANFITQYAALLGGSLKTELADIQAVDGKLPAGTAIPLYLTADSQRQLDDLYQKTVFGSKKSNGFSQAFYLLLQQLNSFKNNAVLGSFEFSTSAQAAAAEAANGQTGQTAKAESEKAGETAAPKGQVYQLLLDNYWDLEHQEALFQQDEDEHAQLITRLTTPQQLFAAGAGETLVFDQLEQAPSDIPPFQTKLNYQPSQTTEASDAVMGQLSTAYDLTAGFNTEVLEEPAVFQSLFTFYGQGKETPGQWVVSGGKSTWRGRVYFTGAVIDANLYQVAWKQDPWMVIAPNQRFIITMPVGTNVEDSRLFADEKQITLKVRLADLDYADKYGLYFYRVDGATGQTALVNSTPIFPEKTGADQYYATLTDNKVQPGQVYVYKCLYATPELQPNSKQAQDEAVGFAQMALKQPVAYSLEVLPGDSTTIVTLNAEQPAFYTMADSITAKIYYQGEAVYQGAEKGLLDSNRLVAAVSPGQDQKGNYIALRLDPGYPCTLGAGGLLQLYFSGSGEFELELTQTGQ